MKMTWSVERISTCVRVLAYMFGGMWACWRGWDLISGDVRSVLPILMCSLLTFLLLLAELTHASQRSDQRTFAAREGA